MIADKLRKSILQAAIQGKLTEQLASDGDARDLLADIQKEKKQLIKEDKIKKEKTLSPIDEDDIPFDIPDNWIWVRLQDVAVFENGDRSNKYPYEQNLVSAGIPFFGAKDMNDGVLEFTNVRFISQKKFDELRNGKLQDNDIVLLLRGSVGKNAVFHSNETYNTGFICAQMVILRLIQREILKYINYFLQSTLFSKFLELKITGTAVRQASARDLESISFPLPPLAEQQRIVERLEKILPSIAALEKDESKLDTLQKSFPKKMKDSLLQAAIQGKLTEQLASDGSAQDLLKEIQAEKKRLIKEGKIKKERPLPEITEDEIPFDIPENWCWVRLGDICTYIQRGKSPKYSSIKKYPVVAQKCNQWSGFSLDKAKFIDPETLESYEDIRLLQDGDLMWNSTGLGTVGRIAEYDSSKNPYELAVADSHVTVIRTLNQFVLSRYVYRYISNPTVQNIIEDQTTGSTKQKELQTSTVKNYLIPLPPLEEQKRIVARLEELLPKCDELGI
jgi:type I restriction enzyme S subunit